MRIVSASAASLLVLGLLLNTGCEWTGGGGTDSFNTSQGAGININFTGVYDGHLGGGLAVARSSGGNITRLTILQTGNRLEVHDNHGSKYDGNVGAPGSVVDLSQATTVPAGAELVQSQITWSGHDEVADKQIEFVGVIHAVSVTDINGTTHNTTRTVTESDVKTTTTTEIDNNNHTKTTTTTLTIGSPGDPFYSVETTVDVVRLDTNELISHTVTKTGSNTTTDTSTTQFTLTEANSQYRLEGTWIENGGVTADVDALSPGGSATLTTTTTTPTT